MRSRRTPSTAAIVATPTRGERSRDALLAAARAVAAEDGWHAVTMRRVADRAGCSPALVYEYFAGKDALLLELVRDGFRLLRARVEAARDTPGSVLGTVLPGEAPHGGGHPGRAETRLADDLADGLAHAPTEPAPAERTLAAMGRAYWTFACESADLYQVMYGLGGTRYPAADTWAEGAAVGAAFAPVVAALSAPGTTPGEVERRVTTLWGTVHGLVALVLAGRVVGGWAGGQALADAAVRDAVRAWRAAAGAMAAGTSLDS